MSEKSLIRRVFSWRSFRRLLFVVACLVTLIALGYAEENWRGKRAWQNYRRQLEAKGEKLRVEDLVPPQVPDDKNFALTPLFKPALDFTYSPGPPRWRDTNGLERLRSISPFLNGGLGSVAVEYDRRRNDMVEGSLQKGTFGRVATWAPFYRGNSNYPQAKEGAPDTKVVLVALAKFDSELDDLRQAAALRPYSRFPISYTYEPNWAMLLPHLGPIKSLTQLTHMRATAALESGGPAGAFEDFKLGWRLSDSVRNEPLLIDHMVRVATLGINLQTVREALVRRAWTEVQLADLETRLAPVDVLAEYEQAMRGERIFNIEGLEFLSAHRRIPIGDDPDLPHSQTDYFNPMPAGWLCQNMLRIARCYNDYILASVDDKQRRVYPAISDTGEQVVEKMRAGPYTIFARMLLPAIQRAVQKSASMQTYVDAARIACALERCRLATGKLPDQLEALVPAFISEIPKDVIDGKPLRYHLKADGSYVIYSIGWNQKDDGGVVAWKEKPGGQVDLAKGDWVWEMPGK